MNLRCFGFFDEKTRYEDQLSWVASSALVAWTCLVCLKAGPTLLGAALLIELMINKLHGLSPSGGLVSPSGMIEVILRSN